MSLIMGKWLWAPPQNAPGSSGNGGLGQTSWEAFLPERPLLQQVVGGAACHLHKMTAAALQGDTAWL